MALESALYNYLTVTATDVLAIVSKRVYPGFLPQGASLPAITYAKVSGPRIEHMGGKTGLEYPRVQINCWASTYSAAKALADKVRIAMDAYSGTWGSDTIRACILQDEADFIDESPELEARRIFGIRQDYEIWHVESTS